MPDGSSLPLETLANVTYGAKQDSGSVFWKDGQRAIAIGLFVPVNQLNVVEFGKKIINKMIKLNKITSLAVNVFFIVSNHCA